MIEKLRNLVWDEEGQGLVEYALIIALISVVLIIALTTLSDGIGGVFGRASEELDAAGVGEG